jgi:glutaconate CoA-transferase subunit B
VVTQLGQYRFEAGEMTLSHLHPGVTLEEVEGATGWEVRTARALEMSAPPSGEELRILREDLDPGGMYAR